MPRPAAPLLHYYDCGEPEGSALLDRVPFALDVPAFGTPRSTSGIRGGQARSRDTPDAASGFATATNLAPGPRFAVSLWFRLTAGLDAWPWQLANVGTSYIAGNNTVRYIIADIQQAVGNPLAGVWNHLAISHDDASGNWHAHLNGAPTFAAAAAPGVALGGTPRTWLLGQPGVAFHPLAIDEVAFFGDMLTDDDAAFLWNGGSGRGYSSWLDPQPRSFRAELTVTGTIWES